MTARRSSTHDRTPHGDLNEGDMHRLLGYRLAQATIVSTHAFEREVGKPLGLRKVEFTILQLVHHNAQTSPAKLARALDITGPGVKPWLDRLEARELLRRSQRDADRRSHRLELTPKGAQLVRSALAALLRADESLMQVLSSAELNMLLELLAKVANARRLEDMSS